MLLVDALDRCTCTDDAICAACHALGAACDCCGIPDRECQCVIRDVDAYDPETGWYSETGCETHMRRL